MELIGKVAVVTGPAKGMGSEITLALAREGADLILVGRDTGAIEPVAAEVATLGRRVEIVRGDIASDPDMGAMAKAALAAFGRIDVLVTVAGVSGPLETALWDTTADQFDEVMAANVRGIFLPCKHVMPIMIERRSGKIVNIGGTYGMRGRQTRSAYSGSKWAMRGLTRSLALEAGVYGINVNAVMPGSVWGPRLERVLHARAQSFGVTYQEMRTRYEDELALRRIPEAIDIANAVLFLASERSRMITGQELVVDGGWVI